MMISLACFQAGQHRLALLGATEAEPSLLLLYQSHSRGKEVKERLRDMADLTGAGSHEPRFQPKHGGFETHARPLIGTYDHYDAGRLRCAQ